MSRCSRALQSPNQATSPPGQTQAAAHQPNEDTMKPTKVAGPKPTPTRPEPTPQMIARMAEAKQRNSERLERPSVKFKLSPNPNGKGTLGEITAGRELRETLLDAFGTTSMVIDGTRPENEAAAMLASQMAVTHALAMDMLSRVRRAHWVDQLNACGALATKLLRTYTMQAEALAKLKRGGEQTVRVEHVHVYQGGQAIVGAVSNRKAGGGGINEKWRQADGASDVRALALAPGPAMFSPDAIWNPLPEGRGDGKETVSDARRSPRQRSPAR